jgi:hypothetical protein
MREKRRPLNALRRDVSRLTCGLLASTDWYRPRPAGRQRLAPAGETVDERPGGERGHEGHEDHDREEPLVDARPSMWLERLPSTVFTEWSERSAVTTNRVLASDRGEHGRRRGDQPAV